MIEKVEGSKVRNILVRKKNRDKQKIEKRIKEEIGEMKVEEGKKRNERKYNEGEVKMIEEREDMDLRKDIMIEEGEKVDGEGWEIEGIKKKGKKEKNMDFEMKGKDIIFQEDNVMEWEKKVVEKNEGQMREYMEQIEKIMEREDEEYMKGNGGEVKKKEEFVRGMSEKRKMSEREIIERIVKGERKIREMVKVIYREKEKRMNGEEEIQVMENMEDMVGRGEIIKEGEKQMKGIYKKE